MSSFKLGCTRVPDHDRASAYGVCVIVVGTEVCEAALLLV
jgi:hypothetical protein